MINKYSKRMKNVRRITVNEKYYNKNGGIDIECIITFDYTENGNLLRRNKVDGSETIYIRDQSGKLLLEMNTLHSQGKRYIYAENQLIQEVEYNKYFAPSIRKVENEYDNRGNIIHRIYRPENGNNFFEWEATYDDRNNQITFYDGFDTIIKRYDNDNRIIEECKTHQFEDRIYKYTTNISYNEIGDITQKICIDYINDDQKTRQKSIYSVLDQNKLEERCFDTNNNLIFIKTYYYEYYTK